MPEKNSETGPDTGYGDNLHHVVITATCFALLLSTGSVVLRLLCRRITRTKWFLDDYLILAALFFEYGITIAGVVLLYNGLGTHIQYVPPEKLVVYMKTLSSGSFLYPLCIAFVKLSILELYRRLFPVRPMIIGVNIVGALVVLWCFGVCLIGAVTCIPFRKLWEPEIPGGCINLAQFYYGLQIPNIVTDAVILAMPMRVVWNLHVPRMQKMLLSGIFLLGLLTLIFDIIRLVAMIELSESGSDITYNQVPPSVWTCIEPAVGITAACLSNMRPLFKLIPRFGWLQNLTPDPRPNNRRPAAPANSKTGSGRLNGTTVVEVSHDSITKGSGHDSQEEFPAEYRV
ncbi:hypothetical protein FE257_006145 [Aspergillus nanangensis]|uniref:Rhodopsin domain-containing protein n=1 Tax=Aspergillus nanangensis TaxID=2582783 RepID=A0AAD4GW75_ASPNN|nr:hypothetical protein FE257_006145 [Aspergillus nanangensis]